MRIQEICRSIRNILENWNDPKFRDLPVSPGLQKQYICTNVSQVSELLHSLPDIPVIKARAKEIFELDINFALVSENESTLPEQARRTLYGNMRYIKTALEGILSMYEAQGFEDTVNGFDVKMPPNITLGNFSKCVKDLDTSFSQCPILKFDECQIKFSGVDKGSTWLIFTVIGTAVGITYILKNIAELVDKIIIIRSHRITYKQQEEELRKAGIANDYIDDLTAVHSKILKDLQEKMIEELCSSHDVAEPEERERVRHSFDLLSNWIAKGMEFYPSIDSPQEIKAAFPAIETQALPDTVLKMLKAPEISE